MKKNNKRCDNNIHAFVRYRSKQRNSYIRKLPNIWLSIIIAVIAVIMLLLSYVLKERDWISGVLISTACGCLTGLVLFFLANERNNKVYQLKKKYDMLESVNYTIERIQNYASKYNVRSKYIIRRSSVFEDACEIMQLLDELEKKSEQLSSNDIEMFVIDEKNLLDKRNWNTYKSGMCALEDEKEVQIQIVGLYNYLIPVADLLHGFIQEIKDQIAFLGSSFV